MYKLQKKIIILLKTLVGLSMNLQRIEDAGQTATPKYGETGKSRESQPSSTYLEQKP